MKSPSWQERIFSRQGGSLRCIRVLLDNDFHSCKQMISTMHLKSKEIGPSHTKQNNALVNDSLFPIGLQEKQASPGPM